MMVNAKIGKVKIEITASEDEKIRDFGEFATTAIIAVCRVIENERRKEVENISK